MTQPLVLIVDDNELNRKLARDVLRASGIDTVEAGDGAEAIELARTRLPDVILLDLRLPDLDGGEALRRLRAEPATTDIPVVAVTALAGARDALLEAGFDDYIEKPIDAVAFPDQVRSFTAAGRLAPPATGREAPWTALVTPDTIVGIRRSKEANGMRKLVYLAAFAALAVALQTGGGGSATASSARRRRPNGRPISTRSIRSR